MKEIYRDYAVIENALELGESCEEIKRLESLPQTEDIKKKILEIDAAIDWYCQRCEAEE